MNKTTKRVLTAILAILFCGGLGYLIFGNQNPKNEENTSSGHVTTIKKTDEDQDEESVDQKDADDTSEEVASSDDKVAFGSNGEILTGANTGSTEPNTKPQSNNKNQGGGSQSGSNKGENAPSKDPNEPVKPVEPNEPVKPVEKTQEQKNDETRKRLEMTYGFKKIAYGNEMPDYRVGYEQYNPVKLEDPNTIATVLNTLDENLKLYPQGFFKEIQDFGMPATIYLVKEIGGTYGGMTDHEFANNVIITVNANGIGWSRVFTHETMHYIDAYMDMKMGSNRAVCAATSAINPVDFKYKQDKDDDGSSNKYVWSEGTKDPLQAYVVDDYGRTNCKEDRAQIFANMMRTLPTGFQEAGTPLNEKAKVIKNQIETYFNTVSPSVIEYWERFVH